VSEAWLRATSLKVLGWVEYASDTSEPEGDVGKEEQEEVKKGMYKFSLLSFLMFNLIFFRKNPSKKERERKRRKGNGRLVLPISSSQKRQMSCPVGIYIKSSY
jgi:hypothetical protein